MDKKQMETLKNAAKNAGLVVAGAGVSHLALKKVPLPEKFNKYKGLLVLAGGVGLQFTGNDMLKELGKGAFVVGGLDAANQFIPEAVKAKAGDALPKLSGYHVSGLGMPVEFSEDEDFETAIDELELGDEFGRVAIEQGSQFG